MGNEACDVISNGMKRKVGTGNNTLFWSDHWVGDNCLKTLYPRLFYLSLQQDAALVLELSLEEATFLVGGGAL